MKWEERVVVGGETPARALEPELVPAERVAGAQ